jgi:hypothetical protein
LFFISYYPLYKTTDNHNQTIIIIFFTLSLHKSDDACGEFLCEEIIHASPIGIFSILLARRERPSSPFAVPLINF